MMTHLIVHLLSWIYKPVLPEYLIQLCVRHLQRIATAHPQRFEDSAPLGILVRTYPFEIVFAPIHDVSILVVALVAHAIDDRSRSMKGRADEDMAIAQSVVTHLRIVATAYAVVTMPATCAAGKAEVLEYMLESATMGEGEELSLTGHVQPPFRAASLFGCCKYHLKSIP